LLKDNAVGYWKPKSRQARARVASLIDILGREYGPVEWEPRYDPASELVYTILSQNTSDVNSERAFKALMMKFSSLDDIAAADVKEIEENIRSGGLAKIKAPRIQEILREIKHQVGSYDLNFLSKMKLDEAKTWLRKLNGVGPKTAAIVLCFSLGMPAMPVDTHIFRVSKRLGLIGKKVNVAKAHDLLERQVAPEEVFAFHIYLIAHGRQICKAQRPRCGQCVLASACPSRVSF
jgi:endonuclease-3